MRSTILAKKKSCFSTASLLKAERLQNAQKQRPEFAVTKNNALKCKTLIWRKRCNLADRYVQNINNVNEKINHSKEEKTSIFYVDRKTGWRHNREPRGNRRQRLHLQHRSGKTHNGRRVRAYGIPHHLITGGDFGFLEGIPENRREVKTGHPLTRHNCAVQVDHSGHRTINALGSRQARFALHLCAPKKMLSFGVSHVSSLVVLLHTFLHEHFLFFIHLSYHTTRTLLYILNISKVTRSNELRHQESLWREKLQTGGNPRTTTPTGYEPKELATVSMIEDYSGDPYQLFDVQEKLREDDHQVCITEEVEEFGKIDQPPSNRRCTSTTQRKALQILILKMENYERMLTSPGFARGT